MKNYSSKTLTSPAFIICLVLLLLNDFIFKEVYHNWFTGKLSDFTGLFVFTVFWASLFPKRKIEVIITTGILFTLWKSPASDSLIHLFNAIAPFKIARVVDYTDLSALLVLPITYKYLELTFKPSKHKILRVSTFCLAIFSFLATSQPIEPSELYYAEYNQTYNFNMSKATLLDKLDQLPDLFTEALPVDSERINLLISITANLCAEGSITYNVIIKHIDDQNSSLELSQTTYYCDEEKDKAIIKQIFETRIINELKK